MFETLHSEKEAAISKFLEDFTSEKFEKIAMMKAELKQSTKDLDENDEKRVQAETEYKAELKKLEKEMDTIRSTGLTEIKTKFVRRKQSLAGKLDMDTAKDRLKASLNTSKSFHMSQTPSAHSFHLSPNDSPIHKKAQQVSPVMARNPHPLMPKTLMAPPGMAPRMPKTPNQPGGRMTGFDFPGL